MPRFRKTFKVGGTRISLGSKSVGISTGVKGFRVGVNSKRGGHITTGLPGTGISHTEYLGKRTGNQQTSASISASYEVGNDLEQEKAKVKSQPVEQSFIGTWITGFVLTFLLFLVVILFMGQLFNGGVVLFGIFLSGMIGLLMAVQDVSKGRLK